MSTDQTKIVSGGNRLGVKLAINTGYTCDDPDGNEQKLYTYLDNYGGKNGLLMEVGNSIERYMERVAEYASAMAGSTNSTCKEVTLKIVTNSGKNKQSKYHIQESEIDKIDKSNIVSIKKYSTDSSSESFSNIWDIESSNYSDSDNDNDFIEFLDYYFLNDPIVLMYILYLGMIFGFLGYKFAIKLLKIYKIK